MSEKIRILVDLNVILDVLGKREPFYADSAGVLAAIETGKTEGMLAAHSITTLFYLVAKEHTPAHAKRVITDLLRFLSIAPVDQQTIQQALAFPWKDFEDSVQAAAAIQAGARYIVTRNPLDYPQSPLPVLQPIEFLGLI